MSTDDAEEMRQVDRLCDRFEAEWKAGRRPALESFLAEGPPAVQGKLLRELLLLDCDYRRKAGEHPAAEDYLRRFAAGGEDVRAVFATRPEAAAPDEKAEAAEAEEDSWLTLTVIEGPRKGQVFRFTSHSFFLVGRSNQAHLQITGDNYMSRLHFMVEINPPSCRLTDLRSRNGTLVGGVRANLADLKHGDVIKTGRTSLLVAMSAQQREAMPSPAEGNETATLMLLAVPAVPALAAIPAPALAHTCMDAVPAAPSEFPLVPGYRILRELGRGGMGVVYQAERLQDKLTVALKTILPAVNTNRKQVKRFLREASMLQQLEHPNIIRCLEVGESETSGLLYFTMEFIEGIDASHFLQKNGALAPAVASRMTMQLLMGLEYAHERRFVHRDIKPANLLIATQVGKKSVKLADFGLARVYQESRLSALTVEGDMGGTLPFMPPEQITAFHKVGPAADQYSAAATLYNLLSNKYPFDFGSASKSDLSVVLQEDPVPLRDRCASVPQELAAVIHRALAKNPEERFPNVRAFRQALIPFAR